MHELFSLDFPRMRKKRHRLLMVLDEFPLFGRMPHFEKNMGAMAGYGLKAYIVCQSPNHISRAYGRDNAIVDNCHIITAFAAADADSAKRISDMAGEVWEVRPQESEQRPRALLGPRKGAVSYREERRPLIGPGDVRRLPRDEQLIFVSGSKPIRAKKLKFDHEKVFAKRLLSPPRVSAVLTTAHDWVDVAPLGRLVKDRGSNAVRVEPVTPAPQGDLFAKPLSLSEQALAGLHPTASSGAPSADPPNEPSPTPSKRKRTPRQMRV